MKLRICTGWREVGLAVGQAWELKGLGMAEVRAGAHGHYELRHRAGMSATELSIALEALVPLRPPTRSMGEDFDVDFELRLGSSKRFSQYDLTLHCDSQRIADRLGDLLGPLGLKSDGSEVSHQSENALKYGGAPQVLRDLIRWQAAQEGVQIRESKDWDEDDNDIWLYVRDPEMAGRPAREFVRVQLETDDPAAVEPLAASLRQRGFAHVELRPLMTDGAWGQRFLVAPGRLGWEESSMELATVHVAVSELLQAQGVDSGRYPVQKHEEEQGEEARVSLPLQQWRRGDLRPYEGPYPERFDIRIRTEDPSKAEGLEAALREAGFPHVLFEHGHESDLIGYTLRWGAAAGAPGLAEKIRSAVESSMRAIGATPGFELALRQTDERDQDVVIDFPVLGIDDGALAERVLGTAHRYNLSLRCPASAHVEDLLTALRDMGFLRAEHLERMDAESPKISYGGAPVALIGRVRELIRARTGLDVRAVKEWDESDDDIWIDLPDPAATEPEFDAGAEEIDFATWLDPEGQTSREAARAFIEVTADTVRVGRVELARWRGGDGHLSPSPAGFAHYCLDAGTAATLEHIALSAALREPCLLEGETSTSKTSSILYLASLLGQPVVRLNLNGQTDTGELIGRYAPEDRRAELPFAAEELDGHLDLFEGETRLILQRAATEGRPLTSVEVQQVMANEGMRGAPWRWQDGLVVQALRRGWWVVLDELNLAEPQILERLNSLLERDPMLVLSEHDNTVIGGAGAPVHPGFRIFGTMNPAEYAGRSVLSPAYRDRWVGYRYAPPADEEAYLAMLRLLVFGEQPEVEVLGHRWQGEDREPVLAGLAEVAEIEGFLVSVARFHAALQSAAGNVRASGRRLGQGAREPYVFTRRGLLRVMDYIEGVVALQGVDDPGRRMREALLRYYVGRMRTAADRAMIARLMDAAGIGPGTWSPGGAMTQTPLWARPEPEEGSGFLEALKAGLADEEDDEDEDEEEDGFDDLLEDLEDDDGEDEDDEDDGLIELDFSDPSLIRGIKDPD